MRKASTKLPEQGTQTPSPAPDLIPAETENQPRTHIGAGTANGGTSISNNVDGVKHDVRRALHCTRRIAPFALMPQGQMKRLAAPGWLRTVKLGRFHQQEAQQSACSAC
jgi:hypothetical protein